MAGCKHFGIEFPMVIDELQAKFYCFNFPKTAAKQGGPEHAEKSDWFWEICYHLWGPKNSVHFVAHPWAEEMVHACSQERYVGLSGCASSGKSDFLAVWGIVNWLAATSEVKVFLTSTSLGEARGRVWGKIMHYWRGAAVRLDNHGKFLDSLGLIRPWTLNAVGARIAMGDTAGIQLIAGERSSEKESVGKLIGFKQKRVLMLADELAELTPAILEACWGNLGPGNPDPVIPNSLDQTFGFQMVAASNFKGYVDPFGVFTEPAAGWKSVNVETMRWKTKRGICLRFDGLKSPNLALSEDKWPIYGRKSLAEHDKLGRNTIQFWRMCRSFPAPDGVSDVIYSQQELMMGGAFDLPVWSERPLLRLAALDPAFTSGGDRSVMMVGTLGYDLSGKRMLSRDQTIVLQEDVTSADPYDKQIAIQFRNKCRELGIEPGNAAIDATGAGISFKTLLGELWSDEVLGVKFGGAASDMAVPNAEGWKPASALYANRVSEISYRGKDFVRAGQIKGIDNDIAEEMSIRRYDVQKGVETRVIVESKRDMKARMGKSPDLFDAIMILLDIAVERHGFSPAGQSQEQAGEQFKPTERMLKFDSVYQEEALLVEPYD